MADRETFQLSPSELGDCLVLATDGSIASTGVSPVGGYASVSPHPLPGWTLDPTKRFYFRGNGVKVFGAELVSVDTMELLAVVDALEYLPLLDARFYVDASYILYGTNKSSGFELPYFW